MRFAALLIAALLVGTAFALDTSEPGPYQSALDIGRVEPGAQVYRIDVRSTDDVRRALRLALERDLKISIRGTNHSQGGHNFLADRDGTPTTIQLMTQHWNRVLHIDRIAEQVVVEPGIIWSDLQRALDAEGFAVITQQSSNIFSVGGAVATNVHGRDNQGPLRNSIVALKLLTADGTELLLNREQNTDLFEAVIGGYGAFGVISEVTLKIARNQAYIARSATHLSSAAYATDFIAPLRAIDGRAHALHWGRVSIRSDRGQLSLGPIVAITWRVAKTQPMPDWKGWKHKPEDAAANAAAALMMKAARASGGGKALKSYLDEVVGTPATDTVATRNNVMNPPAQFLVDYAQNTPGANDILQEYFVPPEQLDAFLEQLQTVARLHQLNLLNITLRYVPAARERSLLAYEREHDLIAVVLYINVRDRDGRQARQISYSGEAWTRTLIDRALALGGTFYLPYQRWWTPAQLRTAYGDDNLQHFRALKQQIDPSYRFDSNFIRALQDAAP